MDVIVGNNGYIFISTTPKKGTELDGGMKDDTNIDIEPATLEQRATRKEERMRICRVSNTIQALADNFIAIYETTIMETYVAGLHYEPKELRRPDVIKKIIVNASKHVDHYQATDE